MRVLPYLVLISSIVISGCAMHLTEMAESVDGRDITPLWSRDLVGAKIRYCGLIENEEILRNFMRNTGTLKRFENALKLDEQVAYKMKLGAKEGMKRRFDANFPFDENDLFISNWNVSLEKYDPDLGGHLLKSFNGRKLFISERVPEESLREYGRVSPKYFSDDFELEASSWATIHGFNYKDHYTFDESGNFRFRPKTVFVKGLMNVIVDIPIDTVGPVGLQYNDALKRYVLKISPQHSKRLTEQAIQRGKDPQIFLSMAHTIDGCSKDNSENLLTGKVVESKVFFLEYSKLKKKWEAGDVISHWFQ